jgi:hypothetical protein
LYLAFGGGRESQEDHLNWVDPSTPCNVSWIHSHRYRQDVGCRITLNPFAMVFWISLTLSENFKEKVTLMMIAGHMGAPKSRSVWLTLRFRLRVGHFLLLHSRNKFATHLFLRSPNFSVSCPLRTVVRKQ